MVNSLFNLFMVNKSAKEIWKAVDQTLDKTIEFIKFK